MTSAQRCALAIGIALAGSTVCRADAVDPSDITQSSYAAPLRGDVIEWSAVPGGETDPVSFEDGSAVVPASARASLAAALARQAPGVRAEVTGRPDPQGKAVLAVARGLAIKRVLLAAGITSDRIVVVSEAVANVGPDSIRGVDSTVRWIPPTTHAAPARFASTPASARPSEAVPVVEPSAAPLVAAAGSAPRSWDVRTQDITLARTLERWASNAGYRLRWDADRNFLIAASDSYEGSFEFAVQAVLASAGIRQSDYPLEACVYANRPPLIRITRMGEQSRECEAP